MLTVTDPLALQRLCIQWETEGKNIALVPTMGFLHAGHESLIRKGRELADKLIVSVFVNPTQFGPNEDLEAYPRSPEKDAAIIEAAGADVLFMPEPAAMYPEGHATQVETPSLAAGLCGITRPVHFRGVCTVVAKLLLLSRAHFAVFGEKDRQQLAIIRRMAKDLFIPVEIVGMPTVREADGLAMSSRNAYLTSEERVHAPSFAAGLRKAVAAVRAGETSVPALAEVIRAHWAEYLPAGREDYLAFVHPDTLSPLDRITGPFVVAAAMYLGKARLIDNMLSTPENDLNPQQERA